MALGLASGNDHYYPVIAHHIPSPQLAYRFTISRSQFSLRRYKTLNRPHLAQPRTPLVQPPRNSAKFDPWHIYSRLITFWAPDFILRGCGTRMKSTVARQAWREKIPLLSIAVMILGFRSFYMLLMKQIMCLESALRPTANVVDFEDPARRIIPHLCRLTG